jgi:hypothetical protein
VLLVLVLDFLIANRSGLLSASHFPIAKANISSVSCSAVPVCRIKSWNLEAPERIWTLVLLVPVPFFFIATRSNMPSPF